MSEQLLEEIGNAIVVSNSESLQFLNTCLLDPFLQEKHDILRAGSMRSLVLKNCREMIHVFLRKWAWNFGMCLRSCFLLL
jgi:hypothetical protein